MTKFSFTIDINAPKTEVWKKVADLGYIQNYNPGVIKSYYYTSEVEGVGAGRVCELAPMGKVKETASEWEDGTRYKLHIVPVEKVAGFKEGYANFFLQDMGPNKTKVTLDFEYDMKYGAMGQVMNVIMVKQQFQKGLQGIMDGLKAHMETGETIEDFRALKRINSMSYGLA